MLSELPPGTGAWRWTFPARNRIMAALAGMTVVVEAAERSGSLITADLAADLGRDLGAVPGRSTRASPPARTTCSPAAPAWSATPRTSSTRCSGPACGEIERAGPALEPSLAAALEAIERGADTRDALAAALDLSGAEAATALASLESLGYLTCSPLGTYTRTGQRAPGLD